MNVLIGTTTHHHAGLFLFVVCVRNKCGKDGVLRCGAGIQGNNFAFNVFVESSQLIGLDQCFL